MQSLEAINQMLAENQGKNSIIDPEQSPVFTERQSLLETHLHIQTVVQ